MHDFSIIGGGIIGLATARELKRRFPDAGIVVLEKEPSLASHQTGRNSGVIHAGIYYAPGSLKARLCKAGVEATIAFCRERSIAYEQCGKLIVATDETELGRMQALHERAGIHGLDVERLDGAALREAEPNVRGLGALHVPATGIVDYAEVSRAMAADFRNAGGTIRCGAAVTRLDDDGRRVEIGLADGSRLQTGFLVACAGLHADRVARLQGIDVDFRIVPYRGEYYRLPERRRNIVKHLIYPVPDPALPFLGVHLTRMIDGGVTVGPNALPGWKREGYGRFNVSLRDSWEQLTYPGFWRVSARFWKTGLAELRDAAWKTGYLSRVRKYCPSIGLSDLRPWPAGIRAQAVRRDGTLVSDFLFVESDRSLHVCNAPSPAATSALPIAEYIGEIVDRKVGHA